MAHIRATRGEWIGIVRAANGVAPGTFGAPDSQGKWWAGGTVEEYPDARIIFREDDSISIVSKTEKGARVLNETGAKLGINVAP